VRVEQRVGEQGEKNGGQPLARRLADRRPPRFQREPKNETQGGEDEQRVAEPAMHGEIRNGVAVIDEDIKIGNSPQDSAEEGSFAALRPRDTGCGNAGSQSDLGQRIHGAIHLILFSPLVARG
jgi:hypothetical protein